MHECIYVCMYVCMYLCMNVCLYECMFVCMYVCMYVCVNTQKSRTLLDHIYISHDVAAIYHGAFNLHISDRSASYLQFNGFNKSTKIPSMRVPATMYRNIKHPNVDNMLADLSQVP